MGRPGSSGAGETKVARKKKEASGAGETKVATAGSSRMVRMKATCGAGSIGIPHPSGEGTLHIEVKEHKDGYTYIEIPVDLVNHPSLVRDRFAVIE